MFIRIQYQCHNVDTSKAMFGDKLSQFVKKMDKIFIDSLKEHGYALQIMDYEPRVGVRELFFIKVVNA